MENPIYVVIKEPVSVRKKILTASKDILKCLQIYEDVKDIRVELVNMEHGYIEEITEIRGLVRRLKRLIPAVEYSSKKHEVKKGTKKKVVKKSKIEKMQNELDDIERELNSIQ